MTNTKDSATTYDKVNDVTDSSNTSGCNGATPKENGKSVGNAVNAETSAPYGDGGRNRESEIRRRSRDYAAFQNKQRKPPSDIPSGTKSVLSKCKEIFEERIQNHEIERLINPFSEFWGEKRNDYHSTLDNAKAVWKDSDKRTKLTKMDMKYGKPVEGTLTEKRGQKARDFIAKNMIELCETIMNCGRQEEDGQWVVRFDILFKAYERINDKLVGLLVRARRHGLVDFPGEMLYQGQDNAVLIRLLKMPTFEELNLKYIKFDAQKQQEALENGEEPSIQ